MLRINCYHRKAFKPEDPQPNGPPAIVASATFPITWEVHKKENVSKKRKESESNEQNKDKTEDHILDYIEATTKKSKPTPQLTVEQEQEVITCLHDVCLPPDWKDEDVVSKDPPYPTEPARTWKFELDPFQKKSVACLEKGESVLVSAHTSAGKTVIAE